MAPGHRRRFAVLVSVLALAGMLLGCTALPAQSGTRLRVVNAGTVPIENLTVIFPDEEIAFGDLPASSMSAYRAATKGVYRYAAYRFQLNGETVTQPVLDWVGEEPIAEGSAFTYALELDPTRPTLQMIRLLGVSVD